MWEAYQIRSDDKIFLGYIGGYITYIVIPEIEANVHLSVFLLSNYYLKLVYATEITKFSYLINFYQIFTAIFKLFVIHR